MSDLPNSCVDDSFGKGFWVGVETDDGKVACPLDDIPLGTDFSDVFGANIDPRIVKGQTWRVDTGWDGEDFLIHDGDDEALAGEEILVPTFEIATNPTIKLSEVKARRFYIVDQAQIHAKEAIQKEEDEMVFNAINIACGETFSTFYDQMMQEIANSMAIPAHLMNGGDK